jgi:hypothetical protein
MSADKLLVWDRNTGDVQISQAGAMDDSIVGAYEEMGMRAGFFDLPSLDIGDVYMHGEQLRQRPKMLLRLDKPRFKAGADSAKIFGIPRGAQVHITDGLTQYDIIADGTTLEVPSPIPARWEISIEAFPYMPRTFEVIAE